LKGQTVELKYQLPLISADYYPRKAKKSFSQWHKPDIMHVITSAFFGQEVGTF
jgi:hypothetical protein